MVPLPRSSEFAAKGPYACAVPTTASYRKGGCCPPATAIGDDQILHSKECDRVPVRQALLFPEFQGDQPWASRSSGPELASSELWGR
jgi:hypothetical protein